MHKIVIIAALCLTSALSLPYEVIENEDGEGFLLVPVSRVRRQTSVDISKSGAGGRATLGHAGTLFENDNHRVDGSAFASKPFKPSGPATVGGQVGYTHLPTGSNLNVGAAKTPGFGTDVSAQGRYNIYRDSKSSLDATGQYQRHFGGASGTGRPNWGAGLQYERRF